MRSTFHGLEVGRRGLVAQQGALYTTGHNIANANTPGYSRQRVNFVQSTPYPPVAFNRPIIPGQMGTGVETSSIQRVRDFFIDAQFRGENSKFGYWDTRKEVLTQMENIMNEPSKDGLANNMDQFWKALQDLAVQPQDSGARRVVQQRGIALADTIKYVHNSLKKIQKDLRNEIDVTQKDVNSLLRQINAVNQQIAHIEPHGYLPNDLYDERDRLVDELSGIVNIHVDRIGSGGNANPNAEGLFNIYLTDSQGNILKDSNGKEVQLLNAISNTAYGIHVQYDSPAVGDSPVAQIKFFKLKDNAEGFADTTTPNASAGTYNFTKFEDFKSKGSLTAVVEGYGYIDDPSLPPANQKNVGLYPKMLKDLDTMVVNFVNYFNEVHKHGWSIKEMTSDPPANDDELDFFEFEGGVLSADRIKVTSAIANDIENIAAATVGKVMERENNVGAYSDPIVTGAYTGTANEIKFKLKYNNTTGEYDVYEMDGITPKVDSLGNPVPSIDPTSTPPEVTVDGLTINVRLIRSPDDGDTWTFSIKKDDEQPGSIAYSGNGINALALADVKNALLDYGGNTTTVQSYFQGMIGDMGVNAAEANRMQKNSLILVNAVEERRMSISNVSLDEEMSNMIKFQHAYNAAARNITTVDEMLDKIINGMGLVGR